MAPRHTRQRMRRAHLKRLGLSPANKHNSRDDTHYFRKSQKDIQYLKFFYDGDATRRAARERWMDERIEKLFGLKFAQFVKPKKASNTDKEEYDRRFRVELRRMQLFNEHGEELTDGMLKNHILLHDSRAYKDFLLFNSKQDTFRVMRIENIKDCILLSTTYASRDSALGWYRAEHILWVERFPMTPVA